MTEKTLAQLQDRLHYGDSADDSVATGLIVDITDSTFTAGKFLIELYGV